MMETVTFVVNIADADGKAIKEGSVLRHIDGKDRGFVVRVVRIGDYGTALDQVGDIIIQTSPGCTRHTNTYANWRHVPHDEQTYEERRQAWLRTDVFIDEHTASSKDQQIAISGIMALLPSDIVDNDYGPWPDTIEDTLSILSGYLTTLGTKETA